MAYEERGSDVNTEYAQMERRYRRQLMFLSLLLVVSAFAAVWIGRYGNTFALGPTQSVSAPLLRQIILRLRSPRIIISILGGASLAAAGFVFQMLFANPLVEPGFLGVSQGAAFGAAATIVFLGYHPLLIQVHATIAALLALYLSYRFAKMFRFGGWLLRLLLSGIAVGALFNSFLSIIKVLADPMTSLQEITFWMMGGLYNITWERVLSTSPVMMSGLFVLLLFRWRINLLSLPDRTGHTLGLRVITERILLLMIATLITTSIISVAGLVSWIGLIVPHLARRLFSSDSRYALPASMLMGALFLLLSDTVARTLLPGEIPLGIITSIFGAILFIIILSGRKAEANL